MVPNGSQASLHENLGPESWEKQVVDHVVYSKAPGLTFGGGPDR